MFIKPETPQDPNTPTPLRIAIEKALAQDVKRQEKEIEIKKATEAKEAELRVARNKKKRVIMEKAKAAKATKPVEAKQ